MKKEIRVLINISKDYEKMLEEIRQNHIDIDSILNVELEDFILSVIEDSYKECI